MTVTELGRRMSSAEFGEWIEYSRLEPVGPAQFFMPPAPEPEPMGLAKLMSVLKGAAPGRPKS